MAVYRFRVTFEEFDEVYRDIDLLATQTFENFESTLLASIGFDAKQSGSFFLSDDYWKKGKQVAVDTSKSKLCSFIFDPHQRFYYVNGNHDFLIELVRLAKEEKGVKYPSCSKKSGEAPKQYPANGQAIALLPEDEMLEEVYIDDSHSNGADEDDGIPAVSDAVEVTGEEGAIVDSDDPDFHGDSPDEELKEEEHDSEL